MAGFDSATERPVVSLVTDAVSDISSPRGIIRGFIHKVTLLKKARFWGVLGFFWNGIAHPFQNLKKGCGGYGIVHGSRLSWQSIFVFACAFVQCLAEPLPTIAAQGDNQIGSSLEQFAVTSADHVPRGSRIVDLVSLQFGNDRTDQCNESFLDALSVGFGLLQKIVGIPISVNLVPFHSKPMGFALIVESKPITGPAEANGDDPSDEINGVGSRWGLWKHSEIYRRLFPITPFAFAQGLLVNYLRFHQSKKRLPFNNREAESICLSGGDWYRQNSTPTDLRR